MISFLSHLCDGIRLGSVYAIIALGYSMVYGIAKMLNFAHGDIIMIGGFTAYSMTRYAGLPPIAGAAAAMIACTVIGVLIERVAYKPLRRSVSLAVLITAIGMSYLLQNAAQLIWGEDTKVFSSVVSLPTIKLFDGELQITGETVVTVAVNILIMAGLTLFTERTKLGKAMRAVSEDKDAAELMGINVNRTISITFAIGSFLAAIAGVLFCSSYSAISPTTGAMPGIKAFTAAVFGGIGSIPGALIGGLLLGIIEILGNAYISTQLGDALVFAVLIIVLLVRPSGLLGKKIHEKV